MPTGNAVRRLAATFTPMAPSGQTSVGPAAAAQAGAYNGQADGIQALARAMIGRGMSSAPADGGPLAALARAVQGPLGAYLMQQSQQAPSAPQAQSGAMYGDYADGEPNWRNAMPVGNLDTVMYGDEPGAKSVPMHQASTSKVISTGDMSPSEEEDLQGADLGTEDWSETFEVIGRAAGGGYRVRDKQTGRTGTWQP